MIAENVLLGTIRAAPANVADHATGGRSARVVLSLIFMCGILIEAQSVDPLMQTFGYIHAGLAIFTPVPLFVTPFELLLMVGLAVALVSTRSSPERRGITLGWPMLLFCAGLFAGLLRGAFAGGDMYVALWEIRFLLYIPAAFVIARSALRRPEHVARLLWLGLLAASLLAAEGAYRKIVLINGGMLADAAEFLYEHNDVIFLATFLVFVVSGYVLRAETRLRIYGLVAAPLLLYTLLASDRRAGIVVLLIGFLVAAVAVFVIRRKAFFASAAPVLIGVVVYVVLFWNASGIIGQPAHAIRSLYEPDARDAASNIYRTIETFNISQTIHDDPFLGVGFGREFLMVAALPDLSWWPFWRYETHNSVLWMWLKTGVLGYLALWILLGAAVSRAAFATRSLTDPQLRVASVFCLVSIVAVLVFSYVDLGMVSPRVTVFLGSVLGIVSVIEGLQSPTAVGAAT